MPQLGPGTEVVDGAGVHYTDSAVTDANGNLITVSGAGWTDTLSRLIPGTLQGPTAGPGTSPGVAEPIPGISSSGSGHCPAGTVSAREWDVPASQQYGTGKATYYLCYSNFTYQTAFDLDTVFGDPTTNQYSGIAETGSSDQSNMPALLLSAVVLPNNTEYTFSYDQYLSLSQITLPTGGAISYQWQNIPFYNPPASALTVPVSRALQTRTVTPGHGQPTQTWTYYWDITFDPPTVSGGPKTTHYPIWSVVTDPEGNDENESSEELTTRAILLQMM